MPEWTNVDAYVIESGVSGIWEYKKWSDGTKECYARIADLSYGTGTSWMGGYYHTTYYTSFPSGLFTNSPRVVATEADAVLTMVVGIKNYTNRVAFYIFNGTSEVGKVTLDVHAMGT